MNPRERESLRKIRRTVNPEGRFGFLRLDKNERVEPIGKVFLQNYKKALKAEDISIYPELEQTKAAVARYAQVPSRHIFLAHGSDAAIKQVFEVFAIKGSQVVLLDPTYAMYEIYTTMAGARPVLIKCNNQFVVDRKKLLASIDKDTSIVVIANPNSPTGSEFSTAFLLRCLKRCQSKEAVLLIDEAYYPFSNATMMPYVTKRDNLVVTRTFSKAFGLAGCRAGFMGASANLIKSIGKARPLYEMNALSSLAIRICLQNLKEANRYVKKVEEGKQYIMEECRSLGLKPYPSHTNFINIRVPNKWSTKRLEDFGKKKGILFKGRLNHPSFKNCIRITLGPKAYMVEFITMLKGFLQDSG